MQPQFQITGQATQNVSLQQNKVLRNTYMLLALSMVPTVAGAIIGVQMGFSLFPGSPMLSFLVFMGIAFGFIWGIQRTKESGMGVALLLGFTFFMGLMLSGILRAALGFSNGGMLIATAAGGTGAIFFTLAGIATAAIDVSDGLLADLGHICERSGCAAAIKLVQLPHLRDVAGSVATYDAESASTIAAVSVNMCPASASSASEPDSQP